MQEILAALIENVGTQAMALQAVADTVSAMKATLLLHYPEIADDLNAKIEEERKKSQVLVANMQKQIAGLREVVSRLSN